MRFKLRRFHSIRLPLLLIVIVGIAILVIFQNCTSSAKLSLLGQPSELNVVTATSIGNFCAGNQALNLDTFNVIFVVDMSLSNIQDKSFPSGGTLFTYTPTDPTGARFDLIRNFLTSSCVNSNPNNRFAVIGFSDTVKGSCDRTAFKPASGTGPGSLDSDISGLQSLQASDYALYSSGITTSFMNNTSYVSALDCVQTMINDKVVNGFTGPTANADRLSNGYMIYFLTDGLPTDKTKVVAGQTVTDLPATNSLLDTKIKAITDFESTQKANSIQLQPIMYGKSKLNAQDALDAPVILGRMTDDGGSSIVAQFDQISDITATQDQLCTYIGSGRKSRPEVLRFGIVNMTARMHQGQLLADSDMDGLLDIEEGPLGFNPAAPRTRIPQNPLLDGLCPRGQPIAKCLAPDPASCLIPNLLGLSSCDVATYQPLYPDGVDSDRDGIPDIVEIVKGTLPNTDDTQSNIDGDSMPLGEEVLHGRDPFFPDDDIDPRFLVQYSHVKLGHAIPPGVGRPGCTLDQQPYQFSIDNIPLVQTKAVVLSPNDFVQKNVPWLAHGKNENVIFIYYIIGRSLDSTTPAVPTTLMGQFIKVSYDKPVIQVGDFKALGTMNGQFVPAPTPMPGQ